MVSMSKRAIIIGAGPAGLTACLELLRRTDIVPIILEGSQEIGGISRTIRYKGYRMDIGGHRFFSKSDRVMQWWMDLMPPELGDGSGNGDPGAAPLEISYQGKRRSVAVPAHLPQEAPLRGMGPLHQEGEDADDDQPGTPEEMELAESHALETIEVSRPQNADLVMLIRPRRSR